MVYLEGSTSIVWHVLMVLTLPGRVSPLFDTFDSSCLTKIRSKILDSVSIV